MAVTVQINGVTLNPQPRETSWETEVIGSKLNGTDASGASLIHILKAPVDKGGTANWNWDTYDNLVLTSIQTHAPYDTMMGTAVTYSSSVVSKPILKHNAELGGIVADVEMRIMIVV